jgi:RNA polymerase sigma factor (sigma-70 family)
MAHPRAPARPARNTPPRNVVDALVRKYQPVVQAEANRAQRMLGHAIDRDDLLCAGMLGLWTAIRDTIYPYDDNRFAAYVAKRVRGEVFDEMRVHDWLSRRERIRVRAGTSALRILRFNDMTTADGGAYEAPDPTGDAWHHRLLAGDVLNQGFDVLSERESIAMRAVFIDGLEQREVAERWGCSGPRVSQYIQRACAKMRLAIENPA